MTDLDQITTLMDLSADSEAVDFRQLKIDIDAKTSEAIKELESLAKTVNAEKLFVSVILAMTMAPADLISEATHGTVPVKLELLAYYLYPFFGISGNKNVSPHQVAKCNRIADQLLTSTIFPTLDDEDDAAASLASSIERHAKIVRGSAYQEQTAEEIVQIQGFFDNWFEWKLGISASRAQAILWQIFEAQQEFIKKHIEEILLNANEYKEEWEKRKRIRSKDRSKEDHEFLSILKGKEYAWHFGRVKGLSDIGFKHYPIDLSVLANPPTEAEIKGLIHLIGLSTETREAVAETIEIRQRPLYVLPDNRVIVVDFANAMDALWDALDAVAKSDGKFWDGKYSKRKGKWLENKINEYLEKIFPADHIYKELSYPDASKVGKATAELDIAVEWGPFLLLVEAKAKQFRLESQLGDVGRLRTDIKANVEDAFEQARRAAKYISETANPEFTEIESGRKLNIDKAKIQRTFLLTVSLHNLAGLATTLAVFEDIGLFKDKEYPFSISLADLGLVTNFIEGPDVFLHYIERRLEVQKLDIEILADEVEFLGAYLDTRFQKELLWERDGEKHNAVSLGGWSEIFDRWIQYKRGVISEQPEISLKIPVEVKEVLAELRKMDDDKSKWIAFNLLSMPDPVLEVLAQTVRELRSSKLNIGYIRRNTIVVEGVTVSGTGAIGVPSPVLIKRAKEITELEKYRRKAGKAIGIAIIPSSKDKTFEHIEFLDAPWRFDFRQEFLIAKEPSISAVSNKKLPGLNEPCFCGSGNKFKKCCSGRVKR